VGADKAGVNGGMWTKSKGVGGVVVVLECGFGRTWSGMDQQEGAECIHHANRWKCGVWGGVGPAP
jgi:hypothetical protein